jgi:hypothetical protein
VLQPEYGGEILPLQHLLGYTAGEEMPDVLYFCKKGKSVKIYYGVIYCILGNQTTFIKNFENIGN